MQFRDKNQNEDKEGIKVNRVYDKIQLIRNTFILSIKISLIKSLSNRSKKVEFSPLSYQK